MAMLAQFFAGQGIEIAGSDTEEKFLTEAVLKKIGARVTEHFSEENIPADADLIVYSTAYTPERNVEVAKALKGKIKTLTYAEALAEVFNQKYGVAVTGSHGKTTTTAWLAFVLEKSGFDPSAMVGSFVPQFDGAGLVGKSDLLVAELDEYQNKLRFFQPRAVLLNNIDYDHPDFFKTKEDYEDAFINFIKKIPAKGFLAANFDDPLIRKLAPVNCRGKVIGYGSEAGTGSFSGSAMKDGVYYSAYDIDQQNGRQYFKVRMKTADEESDLGGFETSLSGKHNVLNALAVIAASIELEVPLSKIREYLGEFTGTARRMETMGEFRGATIIDDYAHHPTEIKATLAGARQLYKDKKIITVFHPHTFTRTKALLDDFAKSFEDTDELVVLDIYGSAREEQGGVHSQDLIAKIKDQRSKIKDISYISTLDECEQYLRNHVSRGDIVLLMGAGDVFRIGESLIGK